MRLALAMLAAALAAAPGTALAGSGTVLPIYLDGSGAPAPLVSRVDERLRVQLVERGLTVAEDPVAPFPADVRIAPAKKDLEKGLAAYRALSLDTAVPALASAEKEALTAPDSPDAPKIVGDARIYLGIIALATGKEGDAAKYFRMVAVADPDRRLDSKQFPPDTVAAYEKARKAVAAGSFADVALTANADGASFLVDGRAVTGASAHVAFGEHLLLASAESGVVAERVVVGEAKSAWNGTIVPDPARTLTSLRAAAKRGDEGAAVRAADALATAAGAARVLLWDLRSTAGRVEAPLRLKDVGAKAFGRAQVADLGTTASMDPALRGSLGALLSPDAAVAAKDPVTPPPRTRGEPHRASGWVWWAAGGLALAAAGGAAAALAQPTGGGTKVAVTVEH